jgi:hypothetical protein
VLDRVEKRFETDIYIYIYSLKMASSVDVTFLKPNGLPTSNLLVLRC